MVVSDTEAVTTQAHSKDTPLPADPWDAPYFGGPIYLAYRPAPLPAPARAQDPERAGPAADPWDAPYFGGPVYFRYPDYPVAGAAPRKQGVAATPSESTGDDTLVEFTSVEALVAAPDGATQVVEAEEVVEATPAAQGRRGGWLARLFGR